MKRFTHTLFTPFLLSCIILSTTLHAGQAAEQTPDAQQVGQAQDAKLKYNAFSGQIQANMFEKTGPAHIQLFNRANQQMNQLFEAIEAGHVPEQIAQRFSVLCDQLFEHFKRTNTFRPRDIDLIARDIDAFEKELLMLEHTKYAGEGGTQIVQQMRQALTSMRLLLQKKNLKSPGMLERLFDFIERHPWVSILSSIGLSVAGYKAMQWYNKRNNPDAVPYVKTNDVQRQIIELFSPENKVYKKFREEAFLSKLTRQDRHKIMELAKRKETTEIEAILIKYLEQDGLHKKSDALREALKKQLEDKRLGLYRRQKRYKQACAYSGRGSTQRVDGHLDQLESMIEKIAEISDETCREVSLKAHAEIVAKIRKSLETNFILSDARRARVMQLLATDRSDSKKLEVALSLAAVIVEEDELLDSAEWTLYRCIGSRLRIAAIREIKKRLEELPASKRNRVEELLSTDTSNIEAFVQALSEAEKIVRESQVGESQLVSQDKASEKYGDLTSNFGDVFLAHRKINLDKQELQALFKPFQADLDKMEQGLQEAEQALYTAEFLNVLREKITKLKDNGKNTSQIIVVDDEAQTVQGFDVIMNECATPGDNIGIQCQMLLKVLEQFDQETENLQMELVGQLREKVTANQKTLKRLEAALGLLEEDAQQPNLSVVKQVVARSQDLVDRTYEKEINTVTQFNSLKEQSEAEAATLKTEFEKALTDEALVTALQKVATQRADGKDTGLITDFADKLSSTDGAALLELITEIEALTTAPTFDVQEFKAQVDAKLIQMQKKLSYVGLLEELTHNHVEANDLAVAINNLKEIQSLVESDDPVKAYNDFKGDPDYTEDNGKAPGLARKIDTIAAELENVMYNPTRATNLAVLAWNMKNAKNVGDNLQVTVGIQTLTINDVIAMHSRNDVTDVTKCKWLLTLAKQLNEMPNPAQ